MRTGSNPEVSAPQLRMVTLGEVAIAGRPGYSWGALPSLVNELVEVAEGLGLTVGRDLLDRPVVSEADARVLYLHMTAPRPIPVEAPRTRGHVPGVTQPDPSTAREQLEVS